MSKQLEKHKHIAAYVIVMCIIVYLVISAFFFNISMTTVKVGVLTTTAITEIFAFSGLPYSEYLWYPTNTAPSFSERLSRFCAFVPVEIIMFEAFMSKSTHFRSLFIYPIFFVTSDLIRSSPTSHDQDFSNEKRTITLIIFILWCAGIFFYYVDTHY